MAITNLEIYNQALSIIGEMVSDSNDSDYQERSTYIIPTFCCTVKDLDKKVRIAEGADKQPSFSTVYMPLDSDFPLNDTMASSAALYLAAMLVLDEDPELSDSIYDKYCDCISSISASVDVYNNSKSGSCETIVEKYFFD